MDDLPYACIIPHSRTEKLNLGEGLGRYGVLLVEIEAGVSLDQINPKNYRLITTDHSPPAIA